MQSLLPSLRTDSAVPPLHGSKAPNQLLSAGQSSRRWAHGGTPTWGDQAKCAARCDWPTGMGNPASGWRMMLRHANLSTWARGGAPTGLCEHVNPSSYASTPRPDFGALCACRPQHFPGKRRDVIARTCRGQHDAPLASVEDITHPTAATARAAASISPGRIHARLPASKDKGPCAISNAPRVCLTRGRPVPSQQTAATLVGTMPRLRDKLHRRGA